VNQLTARALLFSVSLFPMGCQPADDELAQQLENEAAAQEPQELAGQVAPLSLCLSKPKIAVVGAGATGLTTAYLLKQLGYDDVTVFEKDPEVGGFARTRFAEGKPYDLATMFVPGSTIKGDGIEPLLDEMIEVSGEPLVRAVDFGSLVVTPQGNLYSDVSLPVLAACNTAAAIPGCKQQLLDGFALQTRFAECYARGQDPVTCGVVIPGENLLQWGERHNVSLYVRLMLYTADGLGASGDLGRGAPSIGLLAPLAHWMPAETHRALKQLGVPASEIPDSLPNLKSVFAADSQRWWFFENGYQTFWQSLVDEAELDVELSSPVTSIRQVWWRPWEKVTVTVAGPNGQPREHRFDKVIVTTPPGPAAAMLEASSLQAKLLLTAVAGGFPTNVYLAPVGGLPEVATNNLPNPFAFWVKDPSIEPSATFLPAVRPFFWQRRFANPGYMILGAYNYQDISAADSFATLQDYASDTLGMTVGPYTAITQVKFPSAPSDFVQWMLGWAVLQGRQGFYFAGEAFQGSGVPAITEGLASFVPRHFPDRADCWPR
jgi:hypothetical protein